MQQYWGGGWKKALGSACHNTVVQLSIPLKAIPYHTVFFVNTLTKESFSYLYSYAMKIRKQRVLKFTFSLCALEYLVARESKILFCFQKHYVLTLTLPAVNTMY
jgi:hypothetical protein